MAKFLNTSATTYHLEELIKQASERLILISPFLRFNERIRELLEDKNRLKIDIRVVYGKNELQPEEIAWLKSLEYVRLSFCKNLHAKCYLSEQVAIVTSMNLYEFSQVNNNEMGILIPRDTDPGLFSETYQEAQRLIRISEEIKISVERVAPAEPTPTATVVQETSIPDDVKSVSTSQLAKTLSIQPKELFSKFQAAGWISREGGFLGADQSRRSPRRRGSAQQAIRRLHRLADEHQAPLTPVSRCLLRPTGGSSRSVAGCGKSPRED